jgi:hypothetical protein
MAQQRKAVAATAAPRKVNVELDGETRRRLKVYVASNDRKLRDVINEALEEYLRKRNA